MNEITKLRNDASERHWGIWYLSKSKPLSLNIYPYPNPSPYEIELSRLNTPDKVLGWINHLIESKDWLTVDDIRDFLRACRVLREEGLMPKRGGSGDSGWGY